MDMIKRKKKSAPPATNLATAASSVNEPRSASSVGASGGAATQTAATNGASKLVFGLSSRTNKLKHDEYAEQRLRSQQQQQQQLQRAVQTTSAGNQSIVSNLKGEPGTSMSSNQSASAAGRLKKAAEPRSKRSSGSETQASPKKSTQTDLKSDKRSSAATIGVMAKAEQLEASDSGCAKGKSDKKTSGSSCKTSSVRARSRSPDGRVKLGDGGRRKSLEEDLSTMKIERAHQPKRIEGESQQQQQPQPQPQKQQLEQQAVLKPRTQFNITPPPQMSISTGKGGSVVGFAKARIYEKPAKPILPTNSLLHQPSPLDPITASPWCSALDDHGHIPKSISSGLRPPKQVMVSRARKQWEGGEPFTKCKSRKRLAAQANKKLFPGTWSMTSVVATQQLHLQQALAQSSSTSRRSNFQETDPSVKVLTRGSVLERIQQYERVPAPLLSSSSSSSSTSELDDLSPPLSRSSSLTAGSVQDDGVSSSSNGAGRSLAAASLIINGKADYKSRVSSIQSQQNQSTTSSSSSDQLALAKSSSSSTLADQRRLSLRRRSSLLGVSKNSTSSLIPRFYHPNGKPNTYEIEVQKRQIVACFENFPERSAQLDGPSARRHFHQISLACNFSEYFKVPLNLYVKHKLQTCPQLFASINNSSGSLRQRKTSTVSLDTNGTSSAAPRQHVRSNSVVPNQSMKSLSKAASLDSGAAPKTNDQADQRTEVSLISCDHFLACWRDLIDRSFDNASRFVHLLTLGQRNYLLPEDFVPLVQSIIDDHPGLKFLRAAPDFHMRYIQTVIARIYFCINKSWTGKISLQELRKSNLLAVLQVLSQEEDINQITDYFSYEHFYVIYCKFWNLDQDHDLLISKEDLARHNDAAISSRIIERIFSNVVSKQIQKTGKMNYSDFVWFLIAEEDKKHPRSIEYWFRLMDLDGDGYISIYEMEYFYYEQMKRLELMNIEPLPFLDSACQILDLVNPREKNKISLADLKRTKMATIFFDTFVNLEKYLEHESREFVSTRDCVQNGIVVSDWDRYAAEEYENLVVEETTV